MPALLTDIGAASATYRRVTFRFVDASGEKRAFNLRVPVTAALADIETVKATLADITNAFVYEVEVSDVWATTPATSQAVDAVYSTVRDAVVVLHKDIAGQVAQNSFVVAPISALLESASSQVDVDNTDLVAFANAVNAVVGTGYETISFRFSQRRDTNPRTAAS